MVVKAGNIYTKAIFEDFQAQYIKSLELDMISCEEDGDDLVYTVVLHGNLKERRVRKQKDGDVSCSCRLFEMKGFLCSHALKILTNYMNVKEIPNQYILKRWTRKARSESVKDMHGCDIQTDVKLQQTSRYRSLCSMFTKISSRAAEIEETYKISVSHLNQLSKTIEDILSSKMDG
ncbi:protein FAR1-RELATED SEQUENCE 1-like [Prunus persica]|uniref:protein FAR1-RELATED SEQUENCE 1-like n=1 Tax=Prunus persica TaxID=3760 RepID=UPI0009AB4A4E|nr:protein FAR1-RELATED SEQUENCE 1-like [Prunus persica]